MSASEMEYMKRKLYSSYLHGRFFSAYLNVLIVAMPFSTVSGVLVRSCDPSLGAISVAQILTTLCPNLVMNK